MLKQLVHSGNSRLGAWLRGFARGRRGAAGGGRERRSHAGRSAGFHGLQHRGVRLLGPMRRLAFSSHRKPGLHRTGDDRLQHRNPIAQRCCALAFDRLAQPTRVLDWWRSRRACRSLFAAAASETGTYRHVIGGLLIVYAGYLLLRRPSRTLRTGPLSDACAGFLGGLTGGLAGFPGAFVTIWCGLKGWDKARQRGVYQPFILAMQPITLLVIYLMRPASSTVTQLDWKTLTFVPAALLGGWLGLRIFKRLTDRQFNVAVHVLLILSGIGLVL